MDITKTEPPWSIIVKTTSTENKKKNTDGYKGELPITYKGKSIKITAGFLKLKRKKGMKSGISVTERKQFQNENTQQSFHS
jgi:hypothetical protein